MDNKEVGSSVSTIYFDGAEVKKEVDEETIPPSFTIWVIISSFSFKKKFEQGL